MTTTPSPVMRPSGSASRRAFTASGRDAAWTSKRRWTAFETLLTFCPPAPWARIEVSATSSGLTVSGAAFTAGIVSLRRRAAAQLLDHEEQSDRSDHRGDPACALTGLVPAQRLADEPCGERAADAQQDRQNPAHLLFAGQEKAR